MPTTTTERTVGLQAACDTYNATLQPTKDADGNEVLPAALTPDEYWAKVFADYRGDETEQQVYDRACDNYCNQYGV